MMMQNSETEKSIGKIAKEIRDQLSNKQDDILAKIQALVEIESPSRDVENSQAIAFFFEEEAKQIACVSSFERIAAEGLGEHLIIRAFSDEKKEDGAIMLLGHTDTVHPRGTITERPFRIESDKAYGPGIFDMKANCILILEILKAFDELKLKPKREIVILLSCDEEIGSFTGRELVEREASMAKACLVLEPSAIGGRVKTGRKGTGMFTIRTTGIAAHAGLDYEKGVSAILELSKQIEGLHKLTNLELGTTVNVGVFRGGTTSNVIAEHAYAEIDVRFTNIEEALRIKNAILSTIPFDDRVKFEVEGDINRPPLERNENVIALFEQAKRIGYLFDYAIDEAQVGGASDGNFVAALGIPVLDGLGIEGNGAHASHEHIVHTDIANRGALIAGMILEL